MSEEQQAPQGISIALDETEAEQAPQDTQNVDPNVVLNEILHALSGLQAVMGMFDARIGQLEKLTGYLLQKDPQFMANLTAAQEQADAQIEVNKPKVDDGKAEG